ncbi:MAG: IclR family transcriptional regulator [Gemmatimonadales bacterium]
MKHHSTSALLRPQNGTQAIERAFAVLRAFTDTHRVWALADLSREIGLTKPTTLRLLGVLEREGMLQRAAEGGAYRLGATAIELGALAQRANDLPGAARPELEQLSWFTGETASLEVLAGHQILVLDEVPGRFRSSMSECVGARWPAHAAATGKVLLAAARVEDGPDWRDFLAYAGGKLPRFTERTIRTVSRFKAELARVTRQGHAIAVEELESGYVAIGAPVHDHIGRVVAALCLGGPVTRLSPRRLPSLTRRVCEAASRVSARLGGADGPRPRPPGMALRRRGLAS